MKRFPCSFLPLSHFFFFHQKPSHPSRPGSRAASKATPQSLSARSDPAASALPGPCLIANFIAFCFTLSLLVRMSAFLR